MSERKYLNEENYQKSEKKIKLIALFILIIGLFIGGFLIYMGITKPQSDKIEKLRATLEEKRKELVNNGIVYEEMSKYTDGEVYDLYVITKALDPSFAYCEFDEFKNNSITKEYCTAKNSVSDFSISVKIIGGVATCMISFSIYMVAKRRNIFAFQAQQVIPVVKEGIEEMAPTIGNAAGEIAKGIKKGLKDDK